MKELTIMPERDNKNFNNATGIYIRAKHPETGRFGTYDIMQLDAISLFRWLRSRGGCNPWAEDVVGLLFGHEHLSRLMTPEEELAEFGGEEA